MKPAIAILPLLCVAIVLSLAGCASQDTRTTAEPRTEPTPPTTTRTTPPPATTPTRTPALRPLGEAGWETDTMILPVSQQAGGTVRLEKAAPKEVVVGQEFEYRLRITNLTAQPIEGAVLTGKLPTGFETISSTPQASISGLDATWNVGTLAPNESKTYVVRGRATAVGELFGCSDLTFRLSSACITITAVQPALKIALSAPADVLICDPIPLKATVTNDGTGSATNVRLTQTLPDGLTTADGRNQAVFDVGTLAAGQSREVTLEARPARTGEFATRAAVAADNNLSASADARTVVRQPILTVTKDVPHTRFANTPLNYTITVANTGDGEARNTVLVETLPANAVFESAGDGGRHDAGKVTWNLGAIAPNQSRTVTVSLRATTIGQFESYAAAEASCAKGSARGVTTVRGIPAILLEMIDVNDPIAIGEEENYIITITNQGTSAGTNIGVVCEIPEEQEFVSADGPTRAEVVGRRVTFAPLPTLAPGAKAVFTVVTKALREGDTRFRVDLTSDQLEEPVFKTESTHIYSER